MREVPGWLAPVLVASWIVVVLVVRMLGMSERLAASLLACGLGAGAAAWNFRLVRHGGGASTWALAVALAMGLAAILPALRALLPGRRYAEIFVAGDRGELSLPDGLVGPARVLVALAASGDEPARVDFSLRVGTTTHEETLVHGDTVVHAGDWGRAVHLDRRAMYLDVDLPRGAQLSLQRTPSRNVAVHLEVYEPAWPSGIGFALGAFPVVLLLLGPAGRRGGSIPIAATAAAAGLIGWWTITPEHALRPTILSWAAGAVFGVPAGSALTWAKARLRVVRSRVSRLRRRRGQHGARA